MSTITSSNSSEMDILRRIVDADSAVLSSDAAKAILRLRFGPADRQRMNLLAEKNRHGEMDSRSSEELQNYIRVGQMLGILQSKARRSLQTVKASKTIQPGKP